MGNDDRPVTVGSISSCNCQRIGIRRRQWTLPRSLCIILPDSLTSGGRANRACKLCSSRTQPFWPLLLAAKNWHTCFPVIFISSFSFFWRSRFFPNHWNDRVWWSWKLVQTECNGIQSVSNWIPLSTITDICISCLTVTFRALFTFVQIGWEK